MQTEDLKESSKQTTAEETPQQEAQTNTADAANGVDETAEPYFKAAGRF